jgi:hypothetical protein
VLLLLVVLAALLFIAVVTICVQKVQWETNQMFQRFFLDTCGMLEPSLLRSV